jgi:transcriptional regulator with XRE-family HTH domain
MKNEIAKRIIALMEEKNLTLYSVGKSSGIWSSTIQNALESENGFRGALNLYEIAKVLNVSIEYLITGKKSDKEKTIDENQIIQELKKEISGLKSINSEQYEIISDIKKIINRKMKLVNKN